MSEQSSGKVIQWYPGHMTKTFREIEQDLRVVDVIIYVLDSRAPYSTVNPKLSKMAQNKPIIYVLNKADLVEEAELKKWVKYFTKENSVAIALDSTTSNSTRTLTPIIKKLLEDKIAKAKEKNITKIIRTMVVGVPNTGKSTLVNNLCGKARAKTGNKPGVTRGKQWITIDNGIELLDMPGTLWPSFEDKTVAKHLAYLGSIKDDVLDIENLAFDFINEFTGLKNDIFEQRYGVSCQDKECIEIFDEICLAKKCVLKGNEPDYERCAKMIIDDFRKGKFGKIILDKQC